MSLCGRLCLEASLKAGFTLSIFERRRLGSHLAVWQSGSRLAANRRPVDGPLADYDTLRYHRPGSKSVFVSQCLSHRKYLKADALLPSSFLVPDFSS